MSDVERAAEMLVLAMDGDFLPLAGMGVDNEGQDVPLDQARPKEVAWWAAHVLAPLLAEVRAEALAEGERRGGVKALSVTFDVGCDWPTPNHCRAAADALDQLSPARYGAILRAYADAEDARHNQYGPLRVAAHASEAPHA